MICKKLLFGIDKCQQLHLGKRIDLCEELVVDSWSTDKVFKDNKCKGIMDVFEGEYVMKNLKTQKYLGGII